MVTGRLSVNCEVVYEGTIPRRVIIYPNGGCDVLINGRTLRYGTVADTLGNVVIEGPAWIDPESPEGDWSVGDGIEQRMGDSPVTELSGDRAGRSDPDIRPLQWDSTGMDGGQYGFDASQGSGEDTSGEDV